MILASKRGIAVAIAAAFALYLLGNHSVSLWDRDEPRYAQTSRQMLQSGDWVVPRYLDDVRTAKPVLIYWCQALSMKLFGDQGNAGVFAARFPSAVAMTMVLALLAIVLWRCVGPERTFWTLLIIATSGLVVWSAKACTTDAVLLVGITVSQLCVYAIWRGRATWAVIVVLAIAISQSALTKGPVVLGVMGMTLLALGALRWIPPSPLYSGEKVGERGLDVARTLVVIAIIALLVGPWLYLVQQRAPQFLGASVGHDVLKRIAQPLEGHKGPPGYHLAFLFATFFPWSLFLPMAIVSAWQNRADPKVRFAFAAVVGPWIMFEFVRTKLPHYMLPTFPPLAFLAADAIVRCLRGEKDDLRQRAVAIGAGVVGVVAVALGGVTVWAARRFHESVLPALLLTIVAVGFACVLISEFRRGNPRRALLGMGLGATALYAVLFALYLPRADFLRLSARTADILRRADATDPRGLEMLDYKEPSLAFYQGGTIRENRATTITQKVFDDAPPWLVITDDVWSTTPPDIQQRFEQIGSVKGLAYADRARTVEVKVVRKRGADILPR